MDSDRPENEKYVVVKLTDARLLAMYLREVRSVIHPVVLKIIQRFEAEQGSDMEDIVRKLKKLPICGACLHESRAHVCESIEARAQGRRVARLLDRANGIVRPNPQGDPTCPPADTTPNPGTETPSDG